MVDSAALTTCRCKRNVRFQAFHPDSAQFEPGLRRRSREGAEGTHVRSHVPRGHAPRSAARNQTELAPGPVQFVRGKRLISRAAEKAPVRASWSAPSASCPTW
eukprot:3400241-Rhodomonas_salina.1